MQCLNFFPTCEFEWIDPKEFELNKYTGNSSKGCAIEVDLEYPKELRELHSHYPLAPDKNKDFSQDSLLFIVNSISCFKFSSTIFDQLKLQQKVLGSVITIIFSFMIIMT